ncbi:MAG: hypothetical protein COX15_01680 [Candidatus Colwellbacteria bacterium CG23_combo_of_CG06-09_8_20_14_all_42_19]|uniref:Uncharacterized protein n=1 Tax=Candidatus Colwellbacteria bacterium CG23_combo_of_CG06-09_8_20_14_all_42_19 TaxID=1974541 RepID=A0A2H0AKV6_9BACT|nr:MAG: hypothetical protein COX15_01680 [Candidatus Colwellbacteria bacterium CG23_combo_of_CG06-09_8_20_14_all_42_19]
MIFSRSPKKGNPAAQSGFQLTPLSSALWAPKRVYLNKDHIVFTAPVRDDSQVSQTLKGK